MKVSTFQVLALCLLSASPAMAQSDPYFREGFTLSAGAGVGSAGVTCSSCQQGRETAPALYLRLGGAYRPNLILGGEINGWSKTSQDQGDEGKVTVATIDAFAQWYLVPDAGLFLAGGLGIGTMRVEVKVPGLATLSDQSAGLGFHIGVGYDVHLTQSFALTPYVTIFGTQGGKVESSGKKIDANVAHIGLGLTWH
ncbi:MAG: outer membrane beta-barrel protein [Gemmatimonadaceae bacterium]